MRCGRTRRLISDYVDGDLDAGKVRLLEDHVRECPACRELLEDFMALKKEAGGLDIKTPSEGLWSRVQAALDAVAPEAFPEKRPAFLFFPSGFRRAAATAFLILVVIMAGIGISKLWRASGIFSGRNGQKLALAKLEEAERHYHRAIKALWEATQAREADLDPRVAEVFQRNLEIIDASIAACRLAIQEDPENLESRDYLLAAYEKKTDLLNRYLEVQTESRSPVPSRNIY